MVHRTQEEAPMFRYTDSYREARAAKAAGLIVTLSAHGWMIWNAK